jgi:hypothetical protein
VCPIYIYQGEEPPLFLTRPGGCDNGYPGFIVALTFAFLESPIDREHLCPGFEELCTIYADLTGPTEAAPLQVIGLNQGHKEVQVRGSTSLVCAARSRLTLRSSQFVLRSARPSYARACAGRIMFGQSIWHWSCVLTKDRRV